MVTQDPVGTFLAGAIAGVSVMLVVTFVLGVAIGLCARRMNAASRRARDAMRKDLDIL